MEQNAITNRITIVFTDPDLQVIQTALKMLQDTLVPYLVDLDPDARRRLCKLGPKSVDFVSKALSYTLDNPQMASAYVDIDDFQLDTAASTTLRQLQQSLDPLAHLVDSSLMQTGSQAYVAALKCYRSFQMASDENVPRAVSISADLGERFPSRRAKKAAAGTPPTTTIKGSIAAIHERGELAMAA